MFQLLSGSEAKDRLGLDRRTSSFSAWPYEAYLKNSAVLVHQGDLQLSRDLVLDEDEGFATMLRQHGIDRAVLAPDLAKRRISGLVVEGALRIAGALINTNSEGGAFLVVAGAFEARAVSGGGAEIIISGPAVVHETVIGHYNDGILHFDGGLTAKLVVNDDHDLYIGEPQQVGLQWNSNDDYKNEITEKHFSASESDDDVGDVLPLWLAQRVQPDLDRWERLIAALVSGEPVLTEDDALRSEPANVDRIAAQWDRLRLVPEDQRSPALCDAALAGSGLALLYCPSGLRTPQRVAAAVALAPGLLHGIVQPDEVTHEAVMAAAERGGFANLPRAFQSDEVLIAYLRAAKDDSELTTLAELPAKFITATTLPEIRAIYTAHPRYAALEAERSNVAGCDTFYLLTQVWQAFLSEADIIRGLKESGNAEAIHPSSMTPAVCDAMIAYRGSHLELLPPEKITNAHVDLAVSYDGNYLAHVPPAMRTAERCRIAVQDASHALEHVPAALITEDLCQLAIEEDGRALAFVPQALRTEALCRRALRHEFPADMAHVPEDLRATLANER